MPFWYQRSVLTPCTVCFLLSLCSTFNGMYCSCYVVLVVLLLLLLPPYCIVVVCASHPGFLSIVSARIVACFSLCTRNSFFVLSPTPPSLDLSSLFCLFSGWKSSETSPDPFVLGRFTRVLLSRSIIDPATIHSNS